VRRGFHNPRVTLLIAAALLHRGVTLAPQRAEDQRILGRAVAVPR
jgi:hypothetical protein